MPGTKGLEAVAARQFGVVSRAQALEALSVSALKWRLKEGSLERAARGAYRFRGAPPTWEQRALVATLVAGPGAGLSHQTAAWLHQLDGFPRPLVLDVLVPHERQLALPGVAVHRTRWKLPLYRKYGVLPVTSLARTLVDLAAVLSPQRLEDALDSAARRHRELASWLDWLSRPLDARAHPGLSVLRELLAARCDGAFDSQLEVRVARLLRRARLPPFTKRHVVTVDREYVMRLDFAWPALKVALHVDGYRWHQQESRAVRDAAQRSRLTALGWRSLSVMARSLADGAWVDQLRRTLALSREHQR